VANQFLGKQSFSTGLGTHTLVTLTSKRAEKNEGNKPSEGLLPASAPLPVKHRSRAGVSMPSAADWQQRPGLTAHHGTTAVSRRGPWAKQEMLFWVSADGCSFEQPCVSSVRRQLSSSLKTSHPSQHRPEHGSPPQLEDSRERHGTRGSRASAVLGRCPGGNADGGRRREGFSSLVSLLFILLWFINDLSYNSKDINRMLQFQMSPSLLPAPPLSLLSGTLTASFTLIKTNNKLIHLIRVIQKLNSHLSPQSL